MNNMKNGAKKLIKDIGKDIIRKSVMNTLSPSKIEAKLCKEFSTEVSIVGGIKGTDRIRQKMMTLFCQDVFKMKNIVRKYGRNLYFSKPFKDRTYYKKCFIIVQCEVSQETAIITINIFGKKEDRDNIVNELETYMNDKDSVKDDKLTIEICNSIKPENNYENTFQRKTINQVYGNQYKILLEDIRNMYNKKPIFEKHSIPFKFGVLLYGVPGTGKSSFGRILANELNINRVFSINLAENSSAVLSENIMAINNHAFNYPSIVLLEELDMGQNNSLTEKQADEINTKKSMLLNWLDGQLSGNNIIFIATTNHIENIDENILRDGRFSFKQEIYNLDEESAKAMCESFNEDISNYSYIKDSDGLYNPDKLQNAIIKNII